MASLAYLSPPLDVKHSQLFRNEGTGSFSVDTYKAGIGFPSLKMSGWGNGIYDFDNDGFKDLFTANSHVSENADDDPQHHYRQANAVFQNLQDGTFRDVSTQAGPDMQVRATHRGCAFGDLNNDGKMMWLYPPLVIMPNCFTTPQPTTTIGFSFRRSASKATGRNWHAHQTHGRIRLGAIQPCNHCGEFR